ncbi:MAG TPA: FkbM family methyltransferase [Candidatus Rifleibacterium sp.]|nr:FkbM family methyltransferase [Candidatus Rifleibacterium sp.]
MFSLIELIQSQPEIKAVLKKIGILDIGAMLIDGMKKEYSSIFDKGCATVVGFEPVPEECERLNQTYQNTGMLFLPYFIGDGTRQKFYLTNYSMTASLYEPNTELLSRFQNLAELTVPVAEEMVQTQRLDDVSELDFPIDYVKIDIQGAELQAFQGARDRVLKDVLVIQTEAEWLPLYKNQPLFAELELFLRSQGFMVHKFMGFGTRSYKPIIMENNINIGVQHIWSDVIFVRDIMQWHLLNAPQLLKMAVLLHEIYSSYDLVTAVLQEFDQRQQTSFSKLYIELITGQKSFQSPQAKNEEPENQQAAANDFVALFSLGVEKFQQNDLAGALSCFERAKLIRTDFPPLWYNLGLITGKLGKINEAISFLDMALELDPTYKEARDLKNGISADQTQARQILPPKSIPGYSEKLNQALALQNQGKIDQAEAIFQEILAAEPNDVPALFSLGGIEHNRGNQLKALEFFERAAKCKPDFAQIWYNLGIVLQSLKQFDRALAAYDKALQLQPDFSEVRINRGGLLAEMKQHKEALLNYEELLKIDPNNDKALCNRGIILTDFKLYDVAIQTFDRLVQIAPDYDYALGLLAFAKMHACDWANLDAIKHRIIDGVHTGKRSTKTLAMTAITDDPHVHLLCAKIFAQHFFPAREPVWQGEIYKHKKIKVAYVSPDLREHPVGHLTAGLFEHHDKEKFETIAVSLGIDDKSRIRQRMEKAFDVFIDARQIPSFDLARRLREMEVDILVDMAGYTADSRTDLFAFRPAPVQVNYLGYSSTLGLDYFDYIVADRHIIPESFRDAYAEKVVYLPETYLPTDSELDFQAVKTTRKDHGLPEDSFVFCSFNHDYKISQEMFTIWMRLLKSVPASVLWLMKLNESAERNLRQEAAKHGITENRIIFASRVPAIEDHLARYKLADLFLDTFPCNAHSTTSDVLRAGLPMVTCRGRAFAARVAGGLLELVGLPELITENYEDYEKLALKLATDREFLTSCKNRLAANLEQLQPFSTDRYCRHLEAAYLQMWQRYQAGQAPDHIAISQA